MLPLVVIQHAFCQDTISQKQKRARSIILLGGLSAYTAGSLIYLNEVWYKQYKTSSFHFFNDNNEWCQMDKVGHAFTTYQSGRLLYSAMRWAGFDKKKSILLGETYGTLYMTAIEIMDGYSSGWGFSWGDETANVSGGLLFGLQQYFWDEQRIQLKFSTHLSPYAKYRPNELGSNFGERVIKDYNGQTYWLSVNIFSFLKEGSRFPKWLNMAVGYGADGMISGSDNYVIINPDKSVTSFKRYRKFSLSLDVDLSKIKTRSKVLKGIFSAFSVLKVPFPAIRYQNGKISPALFGF